MQSEQQTFDQWKLFCQGGVEEDRKSRDGDDQQGTVPWLLGFRIAIIVQDDQSLDDRSAQESDGADGCLPSSEAEPADDIGKEALAARR